MKIRFLEPRLVLKKLENEKVKKKRFSRFSRGLVDENGFFIKLKN
jgi:hypothetical protein